MIVLNQEKCYFHARSETASEEKQHDARHTALSPKSHIRLAPNIFTKEYLPPHLDSKTLLKCLTEHSDFKTSSWSPPLSSTKPEDVITALNRVHLAKYHANFFRFVTPTDPKLVKPASTELAPASLSEADILAMIAKVTREQTASHIEKSVDPTTFENALQAASLQADQKYATITAKLTEVESLTEVKFRKLNSELPNKVTTIVTNLLPKPGTQDRKSVV